MSMCQLLPILFPSLYMQAGLVFINCDYVKLRLNMHKHSGYMMFTQLGDVPIDAT